MLSTMKCMLFMGNVAVQIYVLNEKNLKALGGIHSLSPLYLFCC